MPRKPRMYLADIPCHVVARGNNRAACFVADNDYLFYLSCLEQAATRCDVAVHAYVLMTNHVHLLLTPHAEDGISRLMQSLGRRYVQYFNRRYERSGTLWEGRHHASLVDAESYLLACYRYIEMNPVRAGLVSSPERYRWSSHRANAGGLSDPVITPHPVYERLGVDGASVRRAYRWLFEVAREGPDTHAIRQAAKFSMPLGGAQFRSRVERALGRPVGRSARGRPRKREGAAGVV